MFEKREHEVCTRQRMNVALAYFILHTSYFILSPTSAYSQKRPYVPAIAPKDTSTFLIFKDVTVGPYFTAGYARQNEDIPEGWHCNSRFAWMLGVTSDFSISPWFGFDLGVLYDTRDLYLATNAGDSDNIDLSIGYLVIQPAIRIAWLLLGLAFDIPTSGSADEAIALYAHPDAPIQPYHQNLNIGTGDLNTLLELRAALSVPIFAAESGTLHLIASANWPLTKTLLSGTSFDTTSHFHVAGNGPLPAFEVGVSYQFDVLH